VVAGGAEIARLVGDRLAGGTGGPTTAFETREPPFRVLPYDMLVDLVAAGSLGALFAAWATEPCLATVRFTGWQMDVATMARHVESELAIHTWDLMRECGMPSLARPSLTAHAVRSLGSFGVIDERATRRTARMLGRGHVALDARLRSPGAADVRIRADATGTVVDLVEAEGAASIELDAGSRLLALWGRRPDPSRPLDCDPALAAWLSP
jgi:hypothetical protein